MGELVRAEHRVDVGGFQTAATVIADPAARAADSGPTILVFAFPGAGYGRRYFDLQIDDRAGSYSQAEHHAMRGVIVIACDHPGCGESDPTNELGCDRIAAANSATVAEMRRRLAAGEAAPGLAPIRDAFAIGIGQSMGGCLTLVAQSRHRPFDAIAVLGYSALHTVLPLPPDTAPEEFSFDVFRYAWHWDDVPAEIVDEDLAGYIDPAWTAPIAAWRSRTVPAFTIDLLTPGYAAADAAAIEVPVFVAAGERDVVPDPGAESSAYRRSRDVTLYVQPRAGHMHNFAGTRALLWDRLADWYARCAALPA